MRREHQRGHGGGQQQPGDGAAVVQAAINQEVQGHARQRHQRHVLHQHGQAGEQAGQRPQVPGATPSGQVEQQQCGGLERQQHGVVVEAVGADVVVRHERGQRHRDQRAPRRHEFAAKAPGERQRNHDAGLRSHERQRHRRAEHLQQHVHDPRRQRRVLPVAVLHRERPDELLGAVDLGRLVVQPDAQAPQHDLPDAQQQHPGERAAVTPDRRDRPGQGRSDAQGFGGHSNASGGGAGDSRDKARQNPGKPPGGKRCRAVAPLHPQPEQHAVDDATFL